MPPNLEKRERGGRLHNPKPFHLFSLFSLSSIGEHQSVPVLSPFSLSSIGELQSSSPRINTMVSKNRAKPFNLPPGTLSRFSAACSEWCLIIFLFITATLSHLAFKFARYFRLQAPCVLCSQLYTRSWFSGDSICDVHKLEISCLAYCQRHNKLGFAQDFCQRCEFSFPNSTEEDLKSDRGECLCCFRKTGNTRILQKVKGKEKVSDRKEQPSDMTNLIDLEEKGYHELKTMSDSESEYKIRSDYPKGSMDTDAKNPSFNIGVSNRKDVVCASVIPDKIIRGNPDLSTNSMIHSDKKIGSAESSEMASSHASIGHGLEDISWNHSGMSNTRGISLSALSRSVPQPAIVEESAKAKEEIGDSECIKPALLEASQATSDPSPPKRTPCHISIQRVLSNRAPVQSPRPSEIISSKSNPRSEEEVKTFISQMSTPRAPRPNTYFDDTTNRRISMSSVDSYEVDLLGDISGEITVDDLKTIIHNLRKELEAERSASTVAANEAMNMITRLQKEKAEVQLESSQYLRMMEEQAEYDHDALVKLNDLLTDREKELLDLEAEVEEFKRGFSEFEKKLGLGDEKGYILKQLRYLTEKQDAKMEALERRERGEPKYELIRLQERFEAIEANQRFTMNVLSLMKENNPEGLKLVVEVMERLRELQKIACLKNQ
ncbi:putative myosin-binding protein 5 isoform X2 [Carex rostrata]